MQHNLDMFHYNTLTQWRSSIPSQLRSVPQWDLSFIFVLLMIEPGAPLNVRASNLRAHQITLEWNPPAHSKGTLTYTVYQVSIRRIHKTVIWQGSLEVNLGILMGSFLVRNIPYRLLP